MNASASDVHVPIVEKGVERGDLPLEPVDRVLGRKLRNAICRTSRFSDATQADRTIVGTICCGADGRAFIGGSGDAFCLEPSFGKLGKYVVLKHLPSSVVLILPVKQRLR